jgi:hypothetical protein
MKAPAAKTVTTSLPTKSVGEILILADGKILAHNISPVLADVLAQLNPADQAMQERATLKYTLNHELPN